MSSLSQISAVQMNANRQNSAHSTGPRTNNGKQRTRLNGLRHGLTGHTVLMPNEDREVYEAFYAETIASLQPSVILLDVVMPDRNGFQVCRELKGSAEFQSIPVILVTSKDTASDKYWGEQQGADAYVTKPFTREELLRAVRRFA